MTPAKISHHLLLCATPSKAKCCDPAKGAATWDALKQGVKRLGLEATSRPEGMVLRSKVDCLRICDRGPCPTDLARWHLVWRGHSRPH
jgi:hypothetical protein